MTDFRALNVVDDVSRERPVIEVDTSLAGERVCRVLERLTASRGLPLEIALDNGPEMMTSTVHAGIKPMEILSEQATG